VSPATDTFVEWFSPAVLSHRGVGCEIAQFFVRYMASKQFGEHKLCNYKARYLLTSPNWSSIIVIYARYMARESNGLYSWHFQTTAQNVWSLHGQCYRIQNR